ncbi:MAG: transglutaminase family protein [Opitutaceae bacterium]|jgi:transglutaminase-like putative cysteine protease|nr:transglutaminase family protein [Opitutaceae bacterium]
MLFQIHHRTSYRYAGEASESFMEARLTPVTDERQKLIERRFLTNPAGPVNRYTDYFGNAVESFAIAHRHVQLVLDSHSLVETTAWEPPRAALEISVSESRQIYRGNRLELFEFLMPSPAIPMSAPVHRLANQFFKPGYSLGEALLRLNHWIKTEFRYAPGSTRIDTPVTEVLAQKAGVCQDFAQVMIAVLRSAELPARYVTGYIETESQRQAAEQKSTRSAPAALVGSAESHAWVEICLPGGFWWALDPTNDCTAGERHVKVAIGRDYLDGTPTRGVFKGTHTQNLGVSVTMLRQTGGSRTREPAQIS